MNILQMKDFNQKEMIRYDKACDIAKENNERLPSRCQYGFFNSQGDLLKSGYVAFDERVSVRARTKSGAIKKFLSIK